MEIVLVSGKDPFAVEASGTLSYIAGLLRVLSHKGIDLTVISSGFTEVNLKSHNLKHIPIKMKRTTSITFLARLMLKIPFTKLPKDSIIHIHRPDFMLPFAIFSRNNPSVCTLHGIPDVGVKTRKNPLIWWVYHLIENFSLSRIDKLIAVNQSTKEYYSSKTKSIDTKIEVIPVGIDTKMFKPMDKNSMRKKYGFDQNDTIILYIGRFSQEKGIDLLLEAFKGVKSEIPGVKLILLGEGQEEDRLRKIVRTQNIVGVEFKKPISHEKIPEIINCADVFALCSSIEGMPTVILEALACGVPVVATDVGDVKKVVEDGKNGRLVMMRDRDFIKDALLDLIENGREAYGKRCIESIDDYSWESVAERIVGVYAELISEKR